MSYYRPEDMLLVAYLDGELPDEVHRRIETLSREDEETRLRLALLSRSADVLREALAESKFSSRNDSAVRRIESWVRPRLQDRVKLIAPLLAACIVGLIAGAALAVTAIRAPMQQDEIAAILDEIADYHAVFARETDHLVEVPASRKADLENWLSDRVGLRIIAPDLMSLGLRFEGGRMLVVDGQPVAQLMYSGAKDQRIALCVSRVTSTGSAKPQDLRQRGLHLIGKQVGRHVFVVAGDDGNELVDALAKRLPGLLSS